MNEPYSYLNYPQVPKTLISYLMKLENHRSTKERLQTDISSKSIGPIWTKLGMHDPCDKGFQGSTHWGGGPKREQKRVILGQT